MEATSDRLETTNEPMSDPHATMDATNDYSIRITHITPAYMHMMMRSPGVRLSRARISASGGCRMHKAVYIHQSSVAQWLCGRLVELRVLPFSKVPHVVGFPRAWRAGAAGNHARETHGVTDTDALSNESFATTSHASLPRSVYHGITDTDINNNIRNSCDRQTTQGECMRTRSEREKR